MARASTINAPIKPEPYKIEILYGISETLNYILKQKLDTQINASFANCFNAIFNVTTHTFMDTMATITKHAQDNNNYISIIISSASNPSTLLSFGQLKLQNSETDKNSYIVNLCTPYEHRGGGWAQIVIKWIEYMTNYMNIKSLYLVPEMPSLIQYYTKLGYKMYDNHVMVKLSK